MISGKYKVLLVRKMRKWIFYLSAYILSKKKYKLRNKYSIIIYSMGKVGSSSLYETFFKEFPFNKIFHLHFLSEHFIKFKLKGTPYYNHNKKLAQKYYRYTNKFPYIRKKFITLVREPISRDISNFFQNYQKENLDLKQLSFEEIIYEIKKQKHQFVLSWFDEEFKKYTGIDIYKYEFNKDRGYSIYNFKDFDLLIIQLEKLNEVYSPALEEFFNIPVNKIFNSNQTNKKVSQELYQKIIKNYYEEEDELHRIYSSKYCRHFYNRSDINKFLHKWIKN